MIGPERGVQQIGDSVNDGRRVWIQSFSLSSGGMAQLFVYSRANYVIVLYVGGRSIRAEVVIVETPRESGEMWSWKSSLFPQFATPLVCSVLAPDPCIDKFSLLNGFACALESRGSILRWQGVDS